MAAMCWRFAHQAVRLSAFVLLISVGCSRIYVTDLVVVEGRHAAAPAGYVKIPKDLNEGAKGKFLYFAVRHGSSKKDALTDIIVVTGKQPNASIPSSYERVPTDLNWGAGGDYIYAAYTRNATIGSPINDVGVLLCGSYSFGCSCEGENAHKILTDLNKGAGGKYVFLCYNRDD